jgi:hypothetical protein
MEFVKTDNEAFQIALVIIVVVAFIVLVVYGVRNEEAYTSEYEYTARMYEEYPELRAEITEMKSDGKLVRWEAWRIEKRVLQIRKERSLEKIK